MSDPISEIHQRFISSVSKQNFPQADFTPELNYELSASQSVEIFTSMITSRCLDLQSREMQKRGRSFYTIGSAGHEGNAAVAEALRVNDMAFLHYRSAGFFIQRGQKAGEANIINDMLLSFAASSDDPISGGRHKVLGSKSLFIPPQTSTIASHLPKAVGAAASIGLSNVVNVNPELAKDSVIFCNFGDASANHSTAQGAINSAAWTSYQNLPMPIIFTCEDNGIGISTATPSGWIAANFKHRAGLNYLFCDGLNIFDVYDKTKKAEAIARKNRKPVFLHMRTVRLFGHAGSDAEFKYLSKTKIAEKEAQDPLLHTSRLLIEKGIMSAEEIVALYQQIKQTIADLAESIADCPHLQTAEQIKQSIVPQPRTDIQLNSTTESQRMDYLGHDKHNLSKPQNMAKLINWALHDIMAERANVVVFGEDVAKKGGVYNVTTHLSESFGEARVFNTLLDEQTILGLAIGLAHNNFLPIPEIQFLAYVHNAEDQIRGEAATLSFFSNGQFTNPMVIRIAGLAYQKGFGGHFHNDNSIAVFRDILGVIIACPSNGEDAVKMLRSCVEIAQTEQRVVIFLEPIALYMTKDLHSDGDQLWAFDYPDSNSKIDIGELGVFGSGKECAIVTFGNGYYLSRKAEKLLAEQGVKIKIIDLRWLAPLNEQAIIKEIEDCEQILIVDETRKTGSISEALVTIIKENLPEKPVSRITAEDSFIPLGSAAYKVLPSVEDIVAVVLSKKSTNSN